MLDPGRVHADHLASNGREELVVTELDRAEAQAVEDDVVAVLLHEALHLAHLFLHEFDAPLGQSSTQRAGQGHGQGQGQKVKVAHISVK